MGGKITKLDTVKDNDGKRFRVVDFEAGKDGHIVAKLKGINADGSARKGGYRKVKTDELEREYTRINLSPVTIRKIDDLSEEEKPMVVKESAPHEKAAQIEKEEVRKLSKKDIEKAVKASTVGGRETPEAHTLQDTFDSFKAKQVQESIEILKAELKDKVQECIDLKKTISKMQQAHEAEVHDLKDQLMEAQAMANAANKYKDEVVAERNLYSESLDDDSVTFEEVLELAETMQLMSTGTAKLAKQIIEKMEERI